MQEAAPFMAGSADQSAAHMMVDLSAARHVWLTKTSLLLLLKCGQMLLAQLTIEAGTVKHIKVSLPCLQLWLGVSLSSFRAQKY